VNRGVGGLGGTLFVWVFALWGFEGGGRGGGVFFLLFCGGFFFVLVGVYGGGMGGFFWWVGWGVLLWFLFLVGVVF